MSAYAGVANQHFFFQNQYVLSIFVLLYFVLTLTLTFIMHQPKDVIFSFLTAKNIMYNKILLADASHNHFYSIS